MSAYNLFVSGPKFT